MDRYTVVVGNFDGVHKGHCELIKLGKQIADSNDEKLAVFTFYPQPQEFFQTDFCYLLSDEKKQEKLKALGVEWVYSVPFEPETGNLSPEDFVTEILSGKMHAAHVVAGFNFSFGQGGKGSPEDLKRICEARGIAVTIMPSFQQDDMVVSSSCIRKFLQERNIEQANRFLGYPYTIEGVVEKGRQLGRTIGYPTANIHLPEKIQLPGTGVYAAVTYVEGTPYQSFLNIGYRPTVEGSVGKTIEVHIFDFSDDLYGKTIQTELFYFMRGEQKFEGLNALKQQLWQDEQDARKMLSAELM